MRPGFSRSPRKPGEGEWDLWDEKPFEPDDRRGVGERMLLTGSMFGGKGGKAVESRIDDYKHQPCCSTPEAIAREYEGQMEQYRKAASLLLGIGIDKVTGTRTVPVRI